MQREIYKTLSSRPLSRGIRCRQPGSYPVKLDTPAINVMTDFQSVTPATVRPDATLRQATHLMISHSVRLLFVTTADGEVLGVITARDVAGEPPIRLLQDRGGRHAELRVGDLMTPHERLEALQMADVLRAEVGHILQTLKESGRQHTLVIEYDPVTRQEEIRGMFSATAIGRRLGVPMDNFEVANTFAAIETALAN
jgi:CBS domain-containing protein